MDAAKDIRKEMLPIWAGVWLLGAETGRSFLYV
jgi:hypothetical protein